MNIDVRTLPAYRAAVALRFRYLKGVHHEHPSAAFRRLCGRVASPA